MERNLSIELTINEDVSQNEIIEKINGFWEANSESESESSLDEFTQNNHEKNSGKISFRKLKRKIHRQYDMNIVHKYSTALDVFVRYIQCYHILYSESSYYCNCKLNMFMLPCMFLSTTCSVMASFKFNKIRETLLLSILNGIIAFLLAIINYLKLDANAEAHKISAYQYSKLKAQIEFNSGETLLQDNDPFLSDNHYVTEQMKQWDKHNKTLLSPEIFDKERARKYDELMTLKTQKEKQFIEKVEKIMVGIKESLKNIEDNNHFALPKHIINKYSTIYNMNIFLYIKSIDTYKNVLLNDLRNVKNEIRFYNKYIQNKDLQMNDSIKQKYIQLYKKKNHLLRDFFELNKGYTLIDSMLQQEIINIELYNKYWILFFIQNIIHCCQCCCGTKVKINILPSQYKKSSQIGYIDEDGEYLLDKVLRH